MAVNLANLSLVRPTATDGALAAAHVPRINATTQDLQRIADTYADATLVDPSHVAFSDGSWLALNPTRNAVERGVGNTLFRGLPQPTGPSPLQGSPASPATPAAPMQPSINLAQYTLTAPLPEHYFLESSRIPHVPRADSASLRATVDATGKNYTLVGQDFYRFDDGSFIAFSPNTGRIERGLDQAGQMLHFRGIPQAPSQMAQAPMYSITPNVVEGFVDRVPTRQELLNAGFTEKFPNYFTHSEGSWVGLDNGQATFGVGNTRVVKESFIPPAPPGGLVKDTSRNGVPASLRGTGIANVGIVNYATPPAHFTSNGFLSDGRGTWVHPDGSWVSTQPFAVGWKGYSLSELPYSNGMGWY